MEHGHGHRFGSPLALQLASYRFYIDLCYGMPLHRPTVGSWQSASAGAPTSARGEVEFAFRRDEATIVTLSTLFRQRNSQ